MDSPDDDTPDDDTLLDDLTSCCEHLMKMSAEDNLMLSTLRVLLLKHGIFSEQEFDEAYQSVGALVDRIRETGAKSVEEVLEPLRLHQLLQDYKGRKQ
jgi:hypothetical protein